MAADRDAIKAANALVPPVYADGAFNTVLGRFVSVGDDWAHTDDHPGDSFGLTAGLKEAVESAFSKPRVAIRWNSFFFDWVTAPKTAYTHGQIGATLWMSEKFCLCVSIEEKEARVKHLDDDRTVSARKLTVYGKDGIETGELQDALWNFMLFLGKND